MANTMTLDTRRCRVEDAATGTRLEAVCVACGPDLVVVVGGGTSYHIGASALAISLPSIQDPSRRTNSSYLASVPGHKEEELARDGALRLSSALSRNVVVTVGIHEDAISKERILGYVALFAELLDRVVADQRAADASAGRTRRTGDVKPVSDPTSRPAPAGGATPRAAPARRGSPRRARGSRRR